MTRSTPPASPTEMTDGQLAAAITSRRRKAAVPAKPASSTPAPKITPEQVAAAWELWGKRTGIIGTNRGKLNAVASSALHDALFYGNGTDKDTCELIHDAALQAVAAMEPKDVIEGMLCQQIYVSYHAAMMSFRYAHHPEQSFEARDMNLRHAEKLMRTHAMLVDTLNRNRGGGQQTIRVERVNVAAGGQAIVGAVTHGGGGGGGADGNRGRPHALAHSPGATMPSAHAEREAVPVASGAGQTAL